MASYRALVGLSFPATEADRKLHKNGKPCKWTRIEADTVTDAIPAASVTWLLRDGHIEEVSDGKARKR